MRWWNWCGIIALPTLTCWASTSVGASVPPLLVGLPLTQTGLFASLGNDTLTAASLWIDYIRVSVSRTNNQMHHLLLLCKRVG
jgi:hypothetical protein